MISRRHLTIISGVALFIGVVSLLITKALSESAENIGSDAGTFNTSLLIGLLITGPAFLIFLGAGAVALIAYMQSVHDKKNTPE